MPTFTAQPDATAGKDARFVSGAPTNNEGAAVLLRAGWFDAGADDYRFAIQFDLSSIPTNAIVSSAQIKFVVSNDFNVSFIIEFYRLRRAWVEGDNSLGSGITWNTYDGSNSWSTGGADDTTNDREAATIATHAVGTTHTGIQTIVLDNTKVQEWISGAFANNGILAKGNVLTGTDLLLADFFSSDDATPSNRPQIIIEYTVPSSGNPWNAYAQQ